MGRDVAFKFSLHVLPLVATKKAEAEITSNNIGQVQV